VLDELSNGIGRHGTTLYTEAFVDGEIRDLTFVRVHPRMYISKQGDMSE
jgi:hypothetical protein